jgi:hypothetical protein
MEVVKKDNGFGNNLITENDVISHAANIFQPSVQEISMLDGRYLNFRRLNENNDGPYVFNIAPQGMQYLQLSTARLFIQGKITDEKFKDLSSASKGRVALANLPGAAMFSSIDISIDGKPYPELSNKFSNYKGYLETVLTYSPDTVKGHLAAAHFAMDTPGSFNDFDPKAADTGSGSSVIPGKPASNKGHEYRASLANGSRQIQISCPLATDFCQIDRFFPPGSKITITLTKADDKFFICSNEDGKTYKFLIEDMYLSIRHVNLAQDYIELHQKELETKPVILPYNKTCISTHAVQANASAMHVINFVDGTLPKSILVGFVKSTNFHGSFKTNPFEFSNCGISSLWLEIGGQMLPSQPYTPDFENHQFTREVCDK